MILMQKSFRIPKTSPEVPRIMKYMMMMLVIATITFIETIILKVLVESSRVTPNWIRNLKTNAVLKYFVFSPFDEIVPEEPKKVAVEVEADTETVQVEIEATKAEVNTKSDWTIFCRFIDRILLLTFGIAFMFYDGN